MEQEINNNENEPVIETPSDTVTTPHVVKTEANNRLTMPMALVIAGVIIALAIILSGNGGIKTKKSAGDTVEVKDFTTERQIAKVTKTDHIRGDLSKAKVAVIEFSDFQCPYCKQLHPTMLRMMEVYGTDVAWTYRHFPLESIHPHARPAAIASECVNELGGNEAFWKFTDGIFSYAGAGTAFDEANFSKIVADTGIDMAAFNSCNTSGKYDKFIDASLAAAGAAGAQGTPDLTAINLKTGEAVHIGADPSLLGQVLDQMIKKE